MDALYFYLSGVTIFFTLLIAVVIILFAVRYRRRTPYEIPRPIAGSHALETLWSVIPFVISMSLGRKRTESNAARSQARFEAELVCNAVVSFLHATHPAMEQQKRAAGQTGLPADETARRGDFFAEPYSFFLNLGAALFPCRQAELFLAEWQSQTLADFMLQAKDWILGQGSEADKTEAHPPTS